MRVNVRTIVMGISKYLGIIKKNETKIYTARAAGGIDFGTLYLIVPSYLELEL
jgi:hypothetical protein